MSEIPDNEIDEIDETRNLQKNIRMSESKVGKTQFVKITKGPTRKSLISFVQSEAFDDFSERVDFMVSFTSLPKQGPRQSDNIDVIVKHLDKLCLKPERDRHQLHLNRIRALKLIKQFIRTGQGDTVLENPACHLIWAMFLCMHHFHVRLKTTSGLISYLRREVLERVYCIICIYCCQLPSGSTAASVCCLAMGIQNHALADKDKMSFEHQSYLHAMAISLLSLVCHIHKADHFYNYVNKVIYNRAKMANHMLPPLKVACEYPRHLVLSNSSEFLLDKWEIRYGLWKSFRIKGKKYENEFAKFAFNTLQ
ncbi:unnamed protein product [Brassicogethes aeneus]|uniref:Uncharacterized protein n=1 Tax=Brassicogethes aeneus TaxID=1431903 RepID=A0A9P0AXY8_BRAAE|nr:unnamed protein product [Brassicogethes aeneus]